MAKKGLALLAWAGALAVSTLGGCNGTRGAQHPPPDGDSERKPGDGGTLEGDSRPSSESAGIPTYDAGPPRKVLAVYLQSTPALEAVRAKEVVRDYGGAAADLEKALRGAGDAGDAGDGGETQNAAATGETCRGAYVLGRLKTLAGDLSGAAAAFDSVAVSCDLSAYAKLRSSQALLKSGADAEALARARAVTGIAMESDARLVVGDALKGDVAGALAIWRAALAAAPNGPRAGELAVKIALAVDGGAPEASPHEVADLLRRVEIENPKYAEANGVPALRAKHGKPALDPAPLEKARIVEGWASTGDGARAMAEADKLAAAWPKSERHGAAYCKLFSARAQASAKTKASSADAWGQAILACDGDDEGLPAALWAGGKASASKRPAEAIDRFQKLETRFPSHRLADDARLKEALLVKDTDPARFLSLLATLPDAFPSGDMRAEALFRVALAKMTAGDWAGAKAPLDRSIGIAPDDHHWATAARDRYFRARVAAATGSPAEARAGYEYVIAHYPLSFYMTQAFARLAESDPKAAEAAMRAGILAEAAASRPDPAHAEAVKSAAFGRAKALLEVGDGEAAKREFASSGATSDAAPPEVLWLVADLYDEAGFFDLGAGFSRGRLVDELPHWPAYAWRAPWEAAYPRAFEPLVDAASKASGVPRSLVWGIMREESAFVTEAKSGASAFGLMQLIAPTAKMVAQGGTPTDEASLKRPDVSILLGARLLGQLRQGYAQNHALALGAYNAGAGAVNRWVTARRDEDFDVWVEEIPYEETRNYVKRVFSSEATYAFLYEPDALTELLHVPRGVSASARAAGVLP